MNIVMQMNIGRNIHRTLTFIPRAWHRRGFGVQSPSDYELVRDVLCESLAYYAYEEQNLKTKTERLLYRLKLHYGDALVHEYDDANAMYDSLAGAEDDKRVLWIANISTHNYSLWKRILKDPRARVTYDMGRTGLVSFDRKRIKQNYLL